VPRTDRPFRFGLQVRGDTSPDDLRSIAVRRENAGFDVLSTFDTPPPVIALLAHDING
jgi:hypothetical protein